jgi:hypothetical protein
MKLTDEDNFFQYYSSFFQGVEITFRRNKFTNELMVLFTDEIAQKIFGFDSVEKMMQDSKIQELMKEFYKQTNEVLFRPSFEYDNIDKN